MLTVYLLKYGSIYWCVDSLEHSSECAFIRECTLNRSKMGAPNHGYTGSCSQYVCGSIYGSVHLLEHCSGVYA